MKTEGNFTDIFSLYKREVTASQKNSGASVNERLISFWGATGEAEKITLRNKVIEWYLPTVISIASSYRWAINGKVTLLDLISEGNLGLIEAVDKNDRLIGEGFDTYVKLKIKGFVLTHIRNFSVVYSSPQYIREIQSQIEKAQKLLSSQLIRDPTIEEIADLIGMTEKEIADSISQKKRVFLFIFSDGPDESTTYDGAISEEQLPQKKLISSTEISTIGEEMERLTSQITTLPLRWQLIFCRRLGISEKSERPLKFSEIALKLRTSGNSVEKTSRTMWKYLHNSYFAESITERWFLHRLDLLEMKDIEIRPRLWSKFFAHLTDASDPQVLNKITMILDAVSKMDPRWKEIFFLRHGITTEGSTFFREIGIRFSVHYTTVKETYGRIWKNLHKSGIKEGREWFEINLKKLGEKEKRQLFEKYKK